MRDVLTPEVLTRLSYYARLTRVFNYLDQHLAQEANLATAADIACMERTSFSKFFKKSVGITYRQFLCALRMERAMAMMSDSDASITEVSAAVGFENLYTFERTFKKTIGCTPREYRRRCGDSPVVATQNSNRPKVLR